MEEMRTFVLAMFGYYNYYHLSFVESMEMTENFWTHYQHFLIRNEELCPFPNTTK